MLITDNASAIDDEALRNSGRAERDLHLASNVATDPLVRVAVVRQESGHVLGPVADRDAVDPNAAVLQQLEHLHFADARYAPAGEDVHDARLSSHQLSGRKAGLRWD